MMRSFIIALAMVAVATASFAIGRSTSGPGAGSAVTTASPASIDISRLHAAGRNLPEPRVDTPY